jgi:hypothetical protein
MADLEDCTQLKRAEEVAHRRARAGGVTNVRMGRNA